METVLKKIQNMCHIIKETLPKEKRWSYDEKCPVFNDICA